MSNSSDETAYRNGEEASHKKYKGIRRRKWGKWVSEIRVPGTPERLWLGSYATPEAAAVAHDVAFYCLRGDSSPGNLNFPLSLPAGASVGISPRSVQRAASDAGLAVDARMSGSRGGGEQQGDPRPQNAGWPSEPGAWSGRNDQEHLNISVEDYL